ncbi:MAG: hypothetical protein WBM43_14035 [Flavobacteriaceae bacterium]
MGHLQKIFDYYIELSVHVALAVVSISLITGILLNIPMPKELVLFIFFGSIASYIFVKNGLAIARFKFLDAGYPSHHIILGIMAGVISIIFGMMLPQRSWTVLLFLLILILLYTFPITNRYKNLRSLGILKVIIVAISWTTVAVYLPAVLDGMVWGWDLNIFALQYFLLVIALIIPFEIRDMRFDPPDIRTIPRKIGVHGTKQLGILLMIFSTMLLFFRDDISNLEIVARAILLIAVCIFIWKTPVKKSKYYASFWIEAIPIFWLGIIWGLKNLI